MAALATRIRDPGLVVAATTDYRDTKGFLRVWQPFNPPLPQIQILVSCGLDGLEVLNKTASFY